MLDPVRAIAIAGLVIYTFGAYAYGALAGIWLREWRVARPARDDAPAEAAPGEPIFGVLIAVSVLWFLTNIALILLRFAQVARLWPVEVAVLCLAFMYPPIIMHLEYAEARARRRQVGWGWRAVLVGGYVLACTVLLASFAAFATPAAVTARAVAGRVLPITLSGLFVLAAGYAIVLGGKADRATTPRVRQARQWTRALLGVTILLFLVLLGFSLQTVIDQPLRMLAGVVEVAARSLPLVFFFVASYHENRFEFFDLFVKRGASLLVAIGWLTFWLALLLPFLRRFDASSEAPWLYALVLVPIVVALPWIFARLGSFLDRRWLGRRFSTVDAMTHFIGRLRPATSEAQLVEHAQAGLGEIFGAPAAVVIGTGPSSGFETVQDIPIVSGGTVVGRVLLGPRTSEAPYFSQDIALAQSLADVLAHVLEHLRLQRRDQAQESRARELTLHASRSELKALRAQINPHFLFNALNAIAGLIHRDPAVADRTVEQLADVFRYALRDAGSEWTLLDDELEFVRAYLEVERARFGERLQAGVVLDDDARGAHVPTMIVQTLVENAVKHGAAQVLGQASVHVRARRDHETLVVSVTDNGPGFADGEAAPSGRGSGYGLANIRQRLDGYFGSQGRLESRRDDDEGKTIVSVSLPLLRQDPSLTRGEPDAYALPDR
jgi:GAF domain-containing protein